jgi:cell wall-associated NlpC family hydrolase
MLKKNKIVFFILIFSLSLFFINNKKLYSQECDHPCPDGTECSQGECVWQYEYDDEEEEIIECDPSISNISPGQCPEGFYCSPISNSCEIELGTITNYTTEHSHLLDGSGPAETSKTPDLNPLGQLQVKIPGIDELVEEYPVVCEDEDDAQTCKIPWVAIYIHAIYNYLIVVGGIVATIALMVGGVIWLMSAGNASRITEAKNWIGGSITGVLILLTSYVLLNHINPNLIGLKYLELETIEPLAGDTNFPSNNGQEGAPFSPDATAEHLTAINIHCPQSGGSSEIKKIAESFRGKVVYRLGSKNGKGDEYNANKTQPTYGLKCPNSKPWEEPVVCYDCSGFARQVLWCAGLTEDPGTGTATIFPGTEVIKKCGNNSINDKDLVPGDLIGWYPKGDGSNSGHVFVYIGNNTLADVYGNRSYSPAKAFLTYSLCGKVNEWKTKLEEGNREIYIKRLSSY